MRKHLHVLISLLAHAMLLVGVAALTLFVVGPLAGSVDNDGDGCPDIPVVVSDSVFFADLSAKSSNVDPCPGATRDGSPTGQLRSATSGTTVGLQLKSADAGCVNHSCCSLRC